MDKKALQEQFEEFARWYVLPLDKSEDGIYRALETQSAWMSFQHQQAKVEELETHAQEIHKREIKLFEKTLILTHQRDELQKRVEAALKLAQSWNEVAFDKTTHWTEGYEEGCYHCAAQLEQALKGEGL